MTAYIEAFDINRVGGGANLTVGRVGVVSGCSTVEMRRVSSLN